MDEKYIVFKREGTNPDGYVYSTGDAIKDAVVIRTQDVFAASGLSAYANNIRAHTAIARYDIKRRGITARHQDEAMFDMIDRLDGIADYFDSCAQEAESRRDDGECKVPD